MTHAFNWLIILSGLLMTFPGYGHHSDAGINMESIVAFEGIVKAYDWRNPHVYLVVETTNKRGESDTWEIQMGSVSVSIRRGWSPDSVRLGDRVSVRVNPKKDGAPYGILESMDIKEGRTLTTRFQIPDGTMSTNSIAGKWIADQGSYPDYPGGYDGLFKALLPLNDKAKRAAMEFDPLSNDNPDAACLGRPTPGGFVSSNLYLMEIEIRQEDNIILIRSERDAEERVVYMDGRDHPDSGVLFAKGHSIGKWEGQTLVVDSRNFTFHRSPYQFGVPSSTQKHVIERYRLNESGTHLDAEFILYDSEYLNGPMKHSRRLIYAPSMKMYLNECELESASRFLR